MTSPPIGCSVAQRVDLPTVAEAAVRNAQHAGPKLLPPICSEHCDANAPRSSPIEPESDQCGATGELAVPFDTRSYLLSHHAPGACARTRLGTEDYACVDYLAGATMLAGKTLSVELDLSDVGCGCNAAIYLVSMPQNRRPGECFDFYCDANNVCGNSCTEIDLMEANQVAWVSTVHVADDPDGDGFGYGHYVTAAAHMFAAEDGADCAYGPSGECAIDTRRPFVARFAFSPSGDAFGFTVTLEQPEAGAGTPSEGGRRRRASIARPVAYTRKPQKGHAADAAAANAELRRALDAGMTLTVSYWGSGPKKAMSWLDCPCAPHEVADWGCSDVWVQHPEWPWACNGSDTRPAACAAAKPAFYMRGVRLHEPPPPPPPAAPPRTFEEGYGTGYDVGLRTGLAQGVDAGLVVAAALLALLLLAIRVRCGSTSRLWRLLGVTQVDDADAPRRPGAGGEVEAACRAAEEHEGAGEERQGRVRRSVHEMVRGDLW